MKKNLKISSAINKTKLIMKLFPQGEKQTLKDFFNEKLEKLFKTGPSNLGYKVDIESLLSDLGMTQDHLLQMTINSLSKTVRNKQEVKIISSYLFFMQDFLKLIKAKGVSEKETILLKDLITLSEAMIYEKQQKDTVMMRFGDKGSTAYIILNGQVDVLIETSFFKNLGEKSYLYYLANLIKYHEFGLLNSTVNDNFKKFPIEIIDDITIKNNNDNINKKESNKFINQPNNNDENNLTNKKKLDRNNSKIKINNQDNNNISFSLSNNMINSINQNINNINNVSGIRAKRVNKTLKKQKFEWNNNNEISSSGRKNDSKKENQPKGFFRLNFMNEEIKDILKVKKFRAKELLDMFGLKFLDKKLNKNLNHCNTEEYIERLNIFDYLEKKQKEAEMREQKKIEMKKWKSQQPKNLDKKNNSEKRIKKEISLNNENIGNKDKKLSIKKVSSKKIRNRKSSKKFSINLNKDNSIAKGKNDDNENEENNLSNSSFLYSIMLQMDKDIIFDLKMHSYMKVVTLGIGSLFGEMALNDANALRKAAIITSSDCHFSVLNKKTFNNCIRLGAQKHLRELLQFFIELPIFNGIPEGVFYHKYYTNLSKFTIVKGKKIISQGDKPEHITLLQTGLYGLTTQMSLYDITRLILRYSKFFNNNDISQDKKNKNNNKENNINLNEIKNKYKLLFQDVINIMNEENSLLNDNMIFKKYYNSQQCIRVAEFSCPEVIMNEEYLDENGLFAFSIEAKAPENVIYTLSNSFYFDLKSKNISVKKNQDKLLAEKMNIMIQRLLIIRNSLINSFFDYKSRNNVGADVIKELEEMLFKQFKKKRSLIKKDEKVLQSNEIGKIDNKGKKSPININLNLNPKGIIHQFSKNKTKDINKYYLENNSLLFKSNSFLKYKSKSSKKSLDLYPDFDNNLKYKDNLIKNRKMHSIKFQKNKNIIFNNKLLKLYKKPLSSSPEDSVNITNKELMSINKLPFKDYEEEILFSLYEDNNMEEKSDISNNNNYKKSIMNDTNNYNISRNQKNQFTQMKNKTNRKTFFNSFGCKLEEQKNSPLFRFTKKVLMNNLIWENIKSVIKSPINQKFGMHNYNKTANNFYKNKNINSNLRNYLENNIKFISKRNKNKFSKKSKTEENKIIKPYNSDKNNSLSKDFSFNSIKIQNFNSMHILSSPSKIKKPMVSTIKNGVNRCNNTEDLINDKGRIPFLNLKQINKSINSINNKMKLKNIYSPHEINFMRMRRKIMCLMDGNKYNKIKEDKFKMNRDDYYKKNVINRMRYFYRNTSD